MRRFLGQVTVVVALTLVVSAILAFTTGSTGPADEERPVAAAADEVGESEQASVDEEPDEAAHSVSGTPDHLDESDNENAGDDSTDVLGVTVAQESESELADTGFGAIPVLFAGAAMSFLGIGVHYTGRRMATKPVKA